jgi:hypothetical protein
METYLINTLSACLLISLLSCEWKCFKIIERRKDLNLHDLNGELHIRLFQHDSSGVGTMILVEEKT